MAASARALSPSVARISRRAVQRNLLAWSLIGPIVVLFIFFFYGPVLYALYLSLTEWSGGMKPPVFIGLENYRKLALQDEVFRHAFNNTILYSFMSVLPGVFGGLAIALMLNYDNGPHIKIFRFAYFVPVVTSAAIMAIVWRFLFQPTNGLLNTLIGYVGIGPQLWLLDEAQALPAIAVTAIWRHVGFTMIIFLAGLQGISDTYYEAAQIDGANRWQLFRHITWPLLTPTTFFVIVTSIISSFQVFDSVRVMTRGGPVDSTNVIVYNIFQNAFETFAMGYGSAIAFILFICILLLTLFQFQVLGKRVNYE